VVLHKWGDGNRPFPAALSGDLFALGLILAELFKKGRCTPVRGAVRPQGRPHAVTEAGGGGAVGGYLFVRLVCTKALRDIYARPVFKQAGGCTDLFPPPFLKRCSPPA
jgi:hypothetical protein